MGKLSSLTTQTTLVDLDDRAMAESRKKAERRKAKMVEKGRNGPLNKMAGVRALRLCISTIMQSLPEVGSYPFAIHERSG